MTIRFSNPTADGCHVAAFIKDADDTSVLQGNTPQSCMERPSVIVRPLQDSGKQEVVMKFSVDIAKVMGITLSQYKGSWPTTGALVSASPTNCPTLTFAVANSSFVAATVDVKIEINYHSHFFARTMQVGPS